MTDIRFTKMHGAGNDFVLMTCVPDSPESRLRDTISAEQIRALCDRRMGIGADGIFFLTPLADPGRFRMDFYNCDGSRAEMCGNGLRCASFLASKIGGGTAPVFETDSGILQTNVLTQTQNMATVRIFIRLNRDFADCGNVGGYHVFSGTAGVPHAVVPVQNTDETDVEAVGRMLRYHEFFAPAGTNVDFVEWNGNALQPRYRIRTYERGVEGETLACGTGIASTGLVLHQFFGVGKKVSFLSRSGDVLDVEFSEECNILRGVYLTGPAEIAFSGMVQMKLK